MLSNDALNNLMKPIIDRQENINKYVVDLIAKRIKEIGHLKPSDIHKLERLLQSGADVRKINEYISAQTGLQVQDIKKLIREVALDSYISAKPFYDYRHLPFISFSKNQPLQNVVKAIELQTLGTYKNMSGATAFMLRDMKNPKKLIPTSIAKTYQTVVDEAIQAVQSGTIDYHTAMRRTLKQLNESGLREVTYNTESGRIYTQRLDTALKRNLSDGVRAINQGVQNEVGKQFKSDGKEISVHGMSAPDHEPVQGHQFTNEEYDKLQSSQPFEDVDGEKFDPIERHIGQYNCRHFTWSIILGISKPNYTKEQLQALKDKNKSGYTLPNGKHLTLYECEQKMREMETAIRRAKEGQMASQEAGDMDLARQYRAKVVSLTKKYKAFCKEAGLMPHMDNASVPGYKTISLKV